MSDMFYAQRCVSLWNAVREFVPDTPSKRRFFHLLQICAGGWTTEMDAEMWHLRTVVTDDLVRMLTTGELEGFGRRSGPGLPGPLAPIPPDWWRGARVDIVEMYAENHGVRVVGIEIRMRSAQPIDNRSAAATPQKRRRIAGGYRESDAPLVREMRQMIEDKTVAGPWAAAQAVAPRAKGSKHGVSTPKRLLKHYSELFGDEQY